MEPKGLNAIPLPNDAADHLNAGIQKYPNRSILPSFIKNLKQDDIILLVIIVLLLTDSNFDDKILVGVLIFLFISGVDGNILGL